MARGPRRNGEAETFWLRMVRGQAASGLSIRAWCRRHDVTEPAFYWWRRQLTRRAREKSKAAFVPVHVAADEGGSTEGQIEIVLTNERRVRLCGRVDCQILADVLAVLESSDDAEARPC
jgi:transposase